MSEAPMPQPRRNLASSAVLESHEGPAASMPRMIDEDKNRSTDMIQPLDCILDIVQTLHKSKCQTKTMHIQQIQGYINDVKNNIINFLLPLAMQTQTKKANQVKSEIETPTYADITKKKLQKNIAVVIKSGADNKVEPFEADAIEKDVINVLVKNKVEATLHAAIPKKNGDIVMMFDKKDNVDSIVDNIQQNLGVEARGRGLILPKMTITHVPRYIDLDSKLEEMIVQSNPRIRELKNEGEVFSVLFSYKHRDLGSVVCKLSPKIREEIIKNGNKIKLGMRICPVKDRLYVMQCGKCLKYNHKTSNCKNLEYVCAWCTEEHLSKECPNKDDPTCYECVNCRRNHETDIGHNAYDHRCPWKTKMLEQLIKRTDWGDNCPSLL